jgi:hypothetical protein
VSNNYPYIVVIVLILNLERLYQPNQVPVKTIFKQVTNGDLSSEKKGFDTAL